MAESLSIITSVDEGLRMGLQRMQEDARTSGRRTGTYDTFETEEADAGDRRGDRDDEKTVGCSPGAFFRHLGSMLTGKEREEESQPLTERRKMSTPVCYLQAIRYLPLAARYVAWGTARQVKKAGMWVVVGLQHYAAHGGYAYPIDLHSSTPATSQAAFWVSAL